MEEIVWARKIREGGIYWPAKIVEKNIKGHLMKCVYKFNGRKWGNLSGNEFQTLEWDCKDKDEYISAGKSLRSTKEQSLFSVAYQKAEEQHNALTTGSERNKEKYPKRKGRPKGRKNGKTFKKCKLQLSDQNCNHFILNSSGSSSLKDDRVDEDKGSKGDDGSVEGFENDNDDNDDDDELPDPFSPIEKPPEKMERGDVVWANFKDEPLWPAIFHSIDKRRKIWVYFFDETWKIQNMKRIVLPVKDVIPLCCGQEKKDMIMREGASLDNEQFGKKQFLQAVEFAEEYLACKASGKISNFFTYESEDEMSAEDSFLNESATPKRKKASRKRKTRKDETLTFKDLIANQSKCSASPRDRHKDLLKAIDATRPTLTRILSEEIDCERHRIFKNGSASQKNMLKHQSGYGPIDDDCIAERLLQKLIRWFLACDNRSNFNSVTYVSEVWLPEAIILGLMASRKISRKQAEKVFGCNK